MGAGAFEDSGDDWSIRITAHRADRSPRAGPVHRRPPLCRRGSHREPGRAWRRQSATSSSNTPAYAEPLVLVLDLSSPIIDDQEIAAMLYGPVVTTMLDPVTVLSFRT